MWGLVFSKPGSPRVPPHQLTPTPPPPSQAKWVDDRATSPEVIEVEEEDGEEEAGASPGGDTAEAKRRRSNGSDSRNDSEPHGARTGQGNQKGR